MVVRMLPSNEFIEDQALIPLRLPDCRIPCVVTDGDFTEFWAAQGKSEMKKATSRITGGLFATDDT
jgi:hypothetical protein